VGAFKPKSLQAPGIEKFLGTQLAYSTEDSVSLSTKHVVIVGGSELALNHALQLCALGADGNTDQTASLTLIHRRDVFQAAPSTVAQFHQAREEKHIEFIEGQITGFTEANGALTSVGVLRADSQTQSVPVDQLLVLLGLSPKLGPIAQWGLDMERRQLRVDTAQFSTSEPGIFAVGDINTYPGKKKLILCGFHEATLASYAAAALIFPDRRETVQYTTTSPRLHKLLGVTLSQAD
jgi:thioredoxin reductase (NADPH)